MTTVEKIEQELNRARGDCEKAKKNLREWEDGDYKGKKLNELEEKLDRRGWRDEEEKKRWEDRVKGLKKEKERLEESKERWKKQVEEWGNALREFGGKKGNEQIA